MKLVSEQVHYPHASEIDAIIWPTVRRNLILKQKTYDLHTVLNAIARCTKLKWPSQKPIPEHSDEPDDLRISHDYYLTFISFEGWAMTSEFLCTYPELVEGLDAENIYTEGNEIGFIRP